MTTIIALSDSGMQELLEGENPKQILTETLHKTLLARTKKKHPKVLYIPTAHDDSELYITNFTKYYLSIGAGDVKALRLIREKPTKKEITTKISTADLIYVNGGNTHRMLATDRTSVV